MQELFRDGNLVYVVDRLGVVRQLNQGDEGLEKPVPISYDWKYIKYRYCSGRIPLERLVGIAETRLEVIETWCFGNSIVDLGCGSGLFVATASRLSDRYCIGYDLVPPQGPYKKFVTCDWNFVIERQWDICTAFDSIEHLPDPSIWLSLNPKYFVLSVPNADESLFDDVERFKRWRHYRPDEHLWYFTKGALVRYLGSFGYDLEYIGHPEDEFRSNDTQDFPNITTAVFRRRR